MQRIVLALLVLMLTCSPLHAAFDNTHRQWNELLKQHVQWSPNGTSTSVNYDGLLKDRTKLNAYLKNISSLNRQEYSTWPLNEQQAFLINAYNAYTIDLVLTRYPDLTSIKDIGGVFSSPWKQIFFTLLGEKRSLDELEHTLLRGDKRYQEPRIHCAVNCASIGCPALRNEAYTAALLANQLEDQTIRFLSDSSRNRFNLKTGKFTVSKIFQWYAEDFNKYSGGIKLFLVRYADKINVPPAEAATIKRVKFKIEYSTYDWTLNKIK